jgi:hypothetical protein
MSNLKGVSTIFGSESGKVIRRTTLLQSEQCYNLCSSLYKVLLFYDKFVFIPSGSLTVYTKPTDGLLPTQLMGEALVSLL